MNSEAEVEGSILEVERGPVDGPNAARNLWLKRREVPVAATRLFSFPYAGGGARIFSGWQEWLGPGVEMVAVELPGRGSHLGTPVIDRMSTMIERLISVLDPLLDLPFALFGHSMGALIAFELSSALIKSGRPAPCHLFVSGMRAPHVPPDHPVHMLADPEFIQHLRKLNGTPPEILENSELCELFLPVVRADLRLVETYQQTSRSPLPLPITVFGGLGDPTLGVPDLNGWALHTRAGCTVRLLPGDHFFIHQQAQVMAASILKSLDMP
jgi:medium-chain acyl-[acyl-carrier-protein] hydrolase